MTKTQLIERYRNCYANDSHLDTSVVLGILTKEEAEALKADRRGEGGIVPTETLQQVEMILKGEME